MSGLSYVIRDAVQPGSSSSNSYLSHHRITSSHHSSLLTLIVTDATKYADVSAVMCKILLKSILKIQNKIVFSKYFSK